MCARITQDAQAIERQFRLELQGILKLRKQFNIGIGERAIILDSQGEWRPVKFGFFHSGRMNFNARAEGFHNKNNELHYTGVLGIHTNPIYAGILKGNRCLIPVSSFLEGPEKEGLSKPFKVSLTDTAAFMLAGVLGTDEKTGEEGFSILTSWPNEAIAGVIRHHRSPVIIPDPGRYQTWLDPATDIQEVLRFLHPVDSAKMAIVELSPKYKSIKVDDPY